MHVYNSLISLKTCSPPRRRFQQTRWQSNLQNFASDTLFNIDREATNVSKQPSRTNPINPRPIDPHNTQRMFQQQRHAVNDTKAMHPFQIHTTRSTQKPKKLKFAKSRNVMMWRTTAQTSKARGLSACASLATTAWTSHWWDPHKRRSSSRWAAHIATWFPTHKARCPQTLQSTASRNLWQPRTVCLIVSPEQAVYCNPTMHGLLVVSRIIEYKTTLSLPFAHRSFRLGKTVRQPIFAVPSMNPLAVQEASGCTDWN